MSESTPAPALPPVPWWERLAAGLLAAAWVGFCYVAGLSPVVWWGKILLCMAGLHEGWQQFLALSTSDLKALIDSRPVLRAITSGIWFAANAGMPVLIAGGLAVASGCYRRRHRRWLWWLALANGVLCGLAIIVQGRIIAVAGAPHTALPPWYEGWLHFFKDGRWQAVPRQYWPLAAEIFLAALVLGVGCWLRRRRGTQAVGVPEKERSHV